MNKFAENLRRIRFEMHMTQEEFATLLGTKKQNISRYESGAVSPKITTAAKIADKLGISLSELSGDQGFSNPRNAAKESTQPKTVEARILSAGADKMPKENRERLLEMARVMFTEYAYLFKEGDDQDET